MRIDGLTRAAIYAAVDYAILHMTGERDEIGFKDYDHDDVAEAVTQSVALALSQQSEPNGDIAQRGAPGTWRCNKVERCFCEDGHDGDHGFDTTNTRPNPEGGEDR